MTTKNMTPRTITLSEETAKLFDCKKMLDEFYDKVTATHNRHFVPNERFSEKFRETYITINSLLMGLLAETIDTNSNISNCKVI